MASIRVDPNRRFEASVDDDETSTSQMDRIIFLTFYDDSIGLAIQLSVPAKSLSYHLDENEINKRSGECVFENAAILWDDDTLDIASGDGGIEVTLESSAELSTALRVGLRDCLALVNRLQRKDYGEESDEPDSDSA